MGPSSPTTWSNKRLAASPVSSSKSSPPPSRSCRRSSLRRNGTGLSASMGSRSSPVERYSAHIFSVRAIRSAPAVPVEAGAVLLAMSRIKKLRVWACAVVIVSLQKQRLDHVT